MKQFHHRHVIKKKKSVTDQGLQKITQYSRNVEYTDEEDKEENNVYINKEMDDEIEASAFQKENDSEREDIAAASCTINHTFSSMSGMQWRPKTSVDMKRKACNMFPLNQVYKIMQKIFRQLQRHSNNLPVRKWWKKFALTHIRERKLFSIVQVTDMTENWKDITPKEL